MKNDIMRMIVDYLFLFACHLGLASSIMWVLEDLKTLSIFTLLNFLYGSIAFSINTFKD